MPKTALISVSDKTDLLPFVKQLIACDIQIISTGGTQKYLETNHIQVKPIESLTHFPEMLDGRLKTLHPAVHGGLLFKRDNADHIKQMQAMQLQAIDIVVVNLYPFKQTIQKENIALSDCIEQIDIGGPTMLRSAAKNYKDVTVITDIADYKKVIDELETKKDVSLELKMYLAQKVFAHTAAYDALIAEYLLTQMPNKTLFQQTFTPTFDIIDHLRYGENPHQQAALYKKATIKTMPFENPLQGKALSYNNIQDADAALRLLQEFTSPTCVAIKHANPCGAASAKDIFDAWQKAYKADEVSIFGGIVAFNQNVDKLLATELSKIFLEIIIAPSFTQEALEIFSKKKNLRLLTYSPQELCPMIEIKSVYGGVLVQEMDNNMIASQHLQHVTNKKTNVNIEELLFAWKVVKHTKSNAIVITDNLQTVGIGVGQTSRIAAAKQAFIQAHAHPIQTKRILASDAFFPFDDVVTLAKDNNIDTIIQPGGSVNDQQSIDACNKHNIAMVFTQQRHFKH